MTDMLQQPATGRAVWLGPDLVGATDWVAMLAPGDIAEVEGALAVAKTAAEAAGKTPLRFARADFPLPTLGARLAALVEEVQHGRGFAVVRGLEPRKYARADLEALYWGLGTHLGNPISQNVEGHLLAEVTDKGSSYATKVNDRGYRSRDKLNPHVDTSDMTTLLCVRQANDGGMSSLASSAAVYNRILVERPDLLPILYRGFHHDLRGEGPTGSLHEVTHDRIPVFSHHEGALSCCYNDKIMRSAHDKCGLPLSEQEVRAIDLVTEIAERPEVRLDFRMREGDIQLINNYTLLHFRTAFESHPDPEERRLLFRLWLNNFEPRPLAADFADRYNTGPRGGVFVRGES